MEINARNYDFSADEPCSDCCIYPTFRIGISHNWGDTTLVKGKNYMNIFGESIKIIDAQFYVSEILLTRENEKFSVDERIEVIDKNGNTTIVPDNFVFVQSKRFSYSVGTFNSGTEFDGIQLVIGVNGNFTSVNENDSFIDDEGFFDVDNFIHTNFRMNYVIDAISNDTLQLNLTNINEIARIDLKAGFEIPLGEDFTIPLIADYKLLLQTIKFTDLASGKSIEEIVAALSDFVHF